MYHTKINVTVKKLICIIIFKGLGTCKSLCTTTTVCTAEVSQFMQDGEC